MILKGPVQPLTHDSSLSSPSRSPASCSIVQHCLAPHCFRLHYITLRCHLYPEILQMAMQIIQQKLEVKIDCYCHVDIRKDCHLNVTRLNINQSVNISRISFICECQLSDTEHNQQTPSTIIRHQTQSSDTKHNHQTPSTITRHHAQSSDTKHNHQTPNTINRHQTQSTATEYNQQTPNTINRH